MSAQPSSSPPTSRSSQGRYAARSSSAWRARIPESTSRPPPARATRQQRGEQRQRRGEDVRDESSYGPSASSGAAQRTATPLAFALAAVASTAAGSMSTASTGARTELRRGDREHARAASVVEHARPVRRRRLRGDPAQTHSRRRVGAGAEGAARIEPDHVVAPAGTSDQVGTIQNSGVTSQGPNCAWVSGPSPVGDGGDREDVRAGPVSDRDQRGGGAGRAGSSAKSASTRARCQAAVDATPGSSKTGCSASVPASASSTEAESASRSSERNRRQHRPTRPAPGA